MRKKCYISNNREKGRSEFMYRLRINNSRAVCGQIQGVIS